MTPPPVPPENVRAVFPDGREVPLEMAYIGQDPCGCHLWDATIPLRIQQAGPFKITCEVLPPETALGVHLEVPVGLVPLVSGVPAEPPPPWRRAPGNN